jgi:porphobilinogen synthase
MTFPGRFPSTRMRRMRRDEFSRRLMRENRLTTDDLIYPCFVTEGTGSEVPVPSLPGISRKSIDLLPGQTWVELPAPGNASVG